MIALFFIVCLETVPSECEERSVAYVNEISPAACMQQAQPELARWSQTHPGWRIARWSCEDPETRAVKA